MISGVISSDATVILAHKLSASLGSCGWNMMFRVEEEVWLKKKNDWSPFTTILTIFHSLLDFLPFPSIYWPFFNSIASWSFFTSLENLTNRKISTFQRSFSVVLLIFPIFHIQTKDEDKVLILFHHQLQKHAMKIEPWILYFPSNISTFIADQWLRWTKKTVNLIRKFQISHSRAKFHLKNVSPSQNESDA